MDCIPNKINKGVIQNVQIYIHIVFLEVIVFKFSYYT